MARWPVSPPCCYTIQYDITKFDIGFIIGIKAFTAAVLGGIGNLRGALVGGLLLGVVEVYASPDLGLRAGPTSPRSSSSSWS